MTVRSTVRRLQRACKAASAGQRTLGALPEWNLADLYPGMDSPGIRGATSTAAEAECKAFEDAYKGKLAELASGTERGAGARTRRSRATRRSRICSAGSSPMPAWSMPATRPTRSAPSSMATSQEQHHRRLAASAVLHARAQPDRRCGARRARCAEPPLAITGPGSRTSARRSPTSSRTARAALPRKVGHRPRRLEPALRRDHGRACASTSTARS